MSVYYVQRSPDYLEHHGILGMKWGVWNSDTAARYNGGRRTKKELTPEEIEAKKIKNAETRRKIWEGAKKVAAYTYDVAKIAGSIYLAKTMTSVMLGQVVNTAMQLEKSNDYLQLGKMLTDPSTQNTMMTAFNTVDKATTLASNGDFNNLMRYLSSPEGQQAMNTFATYGQSTAASFGNAYANSMMTGNNVMANPQTYAALEEIARQTR